MKLYKTHYKRSHLALLIFLVACIFGITSCEKTEQTPSWENRENHSARSTTEPELKAKPEFEFTHSPNHTKATAEGHSTFMYYNIRNYLNMRRGNTERSKPENEIIALIANIIKVNPDILAICEIGDQNDLSDFQQRLKAAGLDLPNTYLTTGTDTTRRQAILSRYSISPHPVPKRTYQMNGREFQMKRGILDASIETPQGKFRFMGAHLKSKRPSQSYDESIVRRNEALILRKHVSSILSSTNSKLIVYGDMNDTKNSPPLRTIKGPAQGDLALKTIELEANDGTRWTQFWSYQDIYSRFDFALTSKAMNQHIHKDKSYVLMVPKGDQASDHRALIITLQ